MLRLVLVSLAVACASALVCPPDACSMVRCALVTAESCVNGIFRPQGSFCGCCPTCVTRLAEGDRCSASLLLGVPPTAECGEGLMCDPQTLTCRSTHHASRAQPLSCADRLQQINAAQSNGVPLLGQFIPRCDSDGSYSAIQCHGSVCFCADPKGAKIEGYQSNIGQSASMNCKCARDQHAYMQTGLIGKMFFCTDNGNYQPYACTGSVCYCADELGARKENSPAVNIGQLHSLRC